MNIYGAIMPGAVSLARIPARLSKEARQRVKWFDYYQQCRNISRTCRYFGISRKTFYKWKNRYNPYYLPNLENKSRRPNHFRESKIPKEHIFLIKNLRTKYPYYSKYKLAVILKRDFNVILSSSTIGRIIKKHHLFFKSKYPSKKKRYAVVFRQKLSKDYLIQAPGDLVESDMKHLPFLGNKRYAFIAIDCAGKGAVVKISSTSSSIQNSLLLKKTKETFPFPVKAWENDNGSENFKDFHQKLKESNIPQYFTHPYCPKDKPFIERLIGTLEKEFIQQGNLVATVEEQQKRIDQWLDEYHNFRPHQSLGYLTPNEYYQKTIGRTIPTNKTLAEVLPM